MRTTTERDVVDFTWLTAKEAALRLGVAADHVLSLGTAGELEVVDLRLPDAKRGVYRVNPASVAALLGRRKMGAKAG